MGRTVINVENLSKRYRIGSNPAGYHTLRESLANVFNAPLRKTSKQHSDIIWALKGVNFEVSRGEVVGIIGRNGAGKSTLLKILSRITKPTEGLARVRGRVGSLLEVGTGFHPELTGRENIYLNGAILGMKRTEIERKFDEIVEFAEISQFLDTAVKYYSSGMYMRLAFSVAAYLEPEILIVDEVLSVGDAQFQKKCLGKMEDVAHEGRTVIFVSHNMGAVNSLCQRGIWIDKGKVFYDGTASQVVSAYLNQGNSTAGQKTWSLSDRPGNSSFKLLSVGLKNSANLITSEINISEEASVEIEYEVIRPGTRVIFSLVLFDSNSYCVFGSISNTLENKFHSRPLQPGNYKSVCSVFGNLLNNGRYYISILGMSDHWSDSFLADYVISFDAIEDGVLKRDYPGSFGGIIRPKLKWHTYQA